jgi:hypothetical protein
MAYVPEGSRRHPDLADLFAGYLEKQALVRSAGLALPELGEVVPHEAAPVQPVDPQLAWSESLEAARLLKAKAGAESWSVPPDWAALVVGQEPAVALSFSLGNFPQLVRHLHLLLHPQTGSGHAVGRPIPAPALVDWAERVARSNDFPQLLLAIGCLRLGRHFELAEQIVSGARKVPAAWQTCWANEMAALAWHRGDRERAVASWQRQPDSVPVHFNRGMSALFLGRPAEARTHLDRAVAQLPEASAWHHLGQLYRTLADSR